MRAGAGDARRGLTAALPDLGRGGAAAGALFLAAAVFVSQVSRHAPLASWLLWRYLLAWTLTAFASAACLAVGYRIVRVLAPGGLDLRERLLLSSAAGVLAFVTTVFVAGIAGVLGPVFFFAAPAGMIALFGPSALRDLLPEARAALARARAERPPWWWTPVAVVGLAGVVLVYVPALAPANISYDARWYHLAIAEHYVAEGAIRRFPEGLVAGGYPETATLLYTWALLSPFGGLEGRIALVSHLEVAAFLATLAGIPAMVRRLAPGVEARGSWAVLFLFPGIFVYDSGLQGGGDHIAAFFAAPILLALLRAWDALEPRACALLAICVCGPILTKYTALCMAAGPLLAFAARAVQLGARWARDRSRQAPWKGALVFAAVGVGLTSQHWLRNWVFYGGPFYPLLGAWFRLRPWTPDANEWLRRFLTESTIPGVTLVHGPADLVRILLTFSIEPHDWPPFHGTVPVFGSLFTAATLALPFLRGPRRLWGGFFLVYAGLSFWALLNPQDRYLQMLLPWMVAVTAPVLLLAVRAGAASRAAATLMVGWQAVWGAYVLCLPSHVHKAPVTETIELVGGRHAPGRAERERLFFPWPEIGRTLPRHARPLIHEGDMHLGLGLPAVVDWLPYAYGLDYGRARSPREVHELLRAAGVTHIVWTLRSRVADSLAGDLVFFSFAHRHARRLSAVGEHAIAAMPEALPPDAPFGSVVLLSCTGPYPAGRYELADLAVPPRAADDPARYPPPRERWDALSPAEQRERLAAADLAVTEPGCADLPSDAASAFERLAERGRMLLYARR